MPQLFEPVKLKRLTVRNRVAMSPLVTFTLNDGTGSVNDAVIEHYVRRAAAGTGLIIVEATAVSPRGKVHANSLGLWEDAQISGFSRLCAAVHAEGAGIILQLCFTGATSKDPSADWVSASEELCGGRTARALTVEEIEQLERDFAAAAVRAVRAGFDGVELHCGHDKLFCRFLDPAINRRKDRYGGRAEDRARIVTETAALIREAVPGDFILGCRVGVNIPGGSEEVLRVLDRAGVDYLHLSRHITAPKEAPGMPADFPLKPILWEEIRLRKLVSCFVLLSNAVHTPEAAAYLMENGFGDMVSVGRAMLADYAWTRKAREGIPVDRCLECAGCRWRTDHHACPAVAAREKLTGEREC